MSARGAGSGGCAGGDVVVRDLIRVVVMSIYGAGGSQQKVSWRLRRQADTLDFGARMRNQLALGLGTGEVVIGDEPVLVWRVAGLGRKAEKASNAQPGIAILTNQRLRFATVDDSIPTDLQLADIEIVHDEDGSVTLRWEDGGGRHAVTLSFSSSRRPTLKHLRRSVLELRSPDAVAAPAPPLSPQQRLLKAVKRS